MSRREKYRTAFLDEGTGDSARRSETLTVTLAGEDLELEVRSLSIDEYESTGYPPACLDDSGQVQDQYADMQASTLAHVHLAQKCCYIPDTDERPFDQPSDAEQILDAPFEQGGWVQAIFEMVDYVHGRQQQPPQGAELPQMTNIKSAASDLKQIARDADDGLDPDEVADIADMIEGYVDLHEGGRGKITTR